MDTGRKFNGDNHHRSPSSRRRVNATINTTMSTRMYTNGSVWPEIRKLSKTPPKQLSQAMELRSVIVDQEGQSIVPQTTKRSSNHYSYNSWGSMNGYVILMVGLILGMSFLGLVTFVIYDLVTNHNHVETSSTSSLSIESQAIDQDGLGILTNPSLNANHRKRDKDMYQRVLVKVINSTDIMAQYGKRIDQNFNQQSNLAYHLYGMADLFVFRDETSNGRMLPESQQCEPIMSSMDLSCCCFVAPLDKSLCQGDGPIKMAMVGSVDVKVFHVTCELVYGTPQNHGLLYVTSKRDLPRVHLGLSLDYINYSFTARNNDCTLRLSFLCWPKG